MTQGRKRAPDATSNTPVMDSDSLASASNAMTELAQRSAEIAQRFDDGLLYDRNRVVNEARFYMGQSAEAMLAAGQRLILLKENEQHGEFIDILEHQLGLAPRTAQKMMQAAVKYLAPAIASNASAPALLGLGKAKLLDLLIEPDEALEGLLQGQTIAGKTLDDMQAMSSRELRAALTEARKKISDKDRVIATKESKVSELEEGLARLQSLSPNEREQAQLDQVRDAGLAAEIAVRQLAAAAGAVLASPATEAASLAASHAVQFVAQVMAAAFADHGIELDLAEMVTPHWLTGVTPQATPAPLKS